MIVSSYVMQNKILRRGTTPEAYRVYRAGLEWDLTDPIVIEKREDIKSELRWRDRVEPYNHQVTNLITFCRRLPVTLLADDVGLGKTISAGLIISELIARSRISKILIVCPKLLGPQWQEELDKKFDIRSNIAIGKELINAYPDEIGAIITTYHSARMHLESIPHDRFQMLVLDEAHKLRNLYGVKKPPQIASYFRQAFEDRLFRFVLMLTATPIHNRLWDIYSLVDLLTVARGHQNPFGSMDSFARNFIADNRSQARKLKPESIERFRSIVYSYMSRVRRGDAQLYFPDRIVLMHKVDPVGEKKLINAIATPIQNLNSLSQISILQALTSSPEALMAQLNNMARKGTVPSDLAETVCAIVARIPVSAKLHGLGRLIDRLKLENPECWRVVVFTGRLETQAAIKLFLETQGLNIGIINGASGPRNQDTIAGFRKNPPDCRVIVSTEAGSEGLNLQVANILVNYDLPWNPMIVEQRIGRIQRLSSEHASVGIFNIILSGTFEEIIVGRLMEKLQMASNAIGDIEALLDASGISQEDENGATGFDEKIRQLVIASLAGKDVEAATHKTEKSILDAKMAMKSEEENINEMLGAMEGTEYAGPRAPILPAVVRSMTLRDFTLAAFKCLGALITSEPPYRYLLEDKGKREHIHFDENTGGMEKSTLYAPGAPAFLRLVSRIITTGICAVEDMDRNPAGETEKHVRQWVHGFSGKIRSMDTEQMHRCFKGTAIIRVRATVVHDSYERLVEVSCSPEVHHRQIDRSGLAPLSDTIQNPEILGININILADAARLDGPISEFCRFYLERRALEMDAAGGDERKKKKLEDEFTPRLEMTIVAIEGKLHRMLKMKVKYEFDAETEYHNLLSVIPHRGELSDAPELALCVRSGRSVPMTCLKQCQITGAVVLQHLLVQSEVSTRLALPEYTVRCSYSGKSVLKDEAELSAVSGRLVATAFLKTSAVSGKRAEPHYFGQCEFTKADVLNTELAVSEISGKHYRFDEQVRSAVSRKTGHSQEFVTCYETRQPISVAETEQCEVTAHYVMPGILQTCSVTSKRVLPSELEQCAATGVKALKKLFVTSSLSGLRILETVAVCSALGKYCIPAEAQTCLWSGQKCHPDDIHACNLTGMPIHFKFATDSSDYWLQPLFDLLNGAQKPADEPQIWDEVTAKVAVVIRKGRCRIESAVLSTDRRHIAVCSEVRTLFGFRVRHIGFVYDIAGKAIVGRVVQGRRSSGGWVEEIKS